MLNEKIVKLINDQINKELYSAYLYLEISNFFGEKALDGFAHWFMEQAKEEQEHAMKFLGYLQENNQAVVLGKIDEPTTKFDDLRAALVAALNHEKFVTAEINKIYALGLELNDFRTLKFLGWFIEEQGEEEANAQALIDRYDLFGKDASGLYALNKELIKRSK